MEGTIAEKNEVQPDDTNDNVEFYESLPEINQGQYLDNSTLQENLDISNYDPRALDEYFEQYTELPRKYLRDILFNERCEID